MITKDVGQLLQKKIHVYYPIRSILKIDSFAFDTDLDAKPTIKRLPGDIIGADFQFMKVHHAYVLRASLHNKAYLS